MLCAMIYWHQNLCGIMCDCQLPTKAAVTQTPENKIVENQVVKEM